MHKPDWVGDRKLGYCTVSVTVSRYLCELEGLARGRLRTGHCCRKRQGIYSFAQNSLPACKRLGERVSVKDDRGQPSIYFPIGDHVNVSWCCSHTNASGVISTSHIVASHITKLLLSFRQILQFRFWDNPQGRIPPWKVTKTRPFLSMCYGDPSATEVPPCCETATNKLTFSTTSVLLLLNMPLSLSRATIFRRQKNPRRVYRPKIAGILFVCNEPEGKYYTVP